MKLILHQNDFKVHFQYEFIKNTTITFVNYHNVNMVTQLTSEDSMSSGQVYALIANFNSFKNKTNQRLN